jgi:MSHA biogenesis protein MshO
MKSTPSDSLSRGVVLPAQPHEDLGVVFARSSPRTQRGTLHCAVLRRTSPGYTSMCTRSAERSSASLKSTAEPLCPGGTRANRRFTLRGHAARDGQLACSQRCAGFTLLELVVGLVLSTIVIGFAASLMTTPVEAYYAQTRRTELVENSELITHSLQRDLAMAVPNSVRIRNAGNRAIVEMLLAEVVTFYRPAGSLGAAGPWSAADRELDFAAADGRLSVFGRIDPLQSANNYNPPNRFLVVNNEGTGMNDAYRLARVITPAPVTLSIARDPGSYAATGEEQLNFAPAFRFRNLPPNGSSRLFLVRGPIAYICNSTANTATLRRYDNYAITMAIPANEGAAQLNAAGVRNAVLANNVSACRLSCRGVTNAAPCLSTLTVEIALSRPAGTNNESIDIYRQLAVDNIP